MKLRLFNTLTKEKEELKPIEDKIVKMYVCGPTVYGYDHLGHARVAIFYDIVRRYLKYLGYKVQFVQNITDVGELTGTETGEDKIEKQAKLEKKNPIEIARYYEKEHFKDMKALYVLKPDFSPRASEYIPQIIKFIEKLIQKGFAYKTGSGVYFDVSKFKDYGKLSKIKDFLQAEGVRIELKDDKKDPKDFALWRKSAPDHILKWSSPWGDGYPGWHIECSVMNLEIFGATTDIHGGAIELAFPHHENEIAQSESITGKPFVKIWLHLGLVKVGGMKMSKSIGNVINIKDLLKKYDANLIRYTLISSYYRKPFDYKEEVFQQAKTIIEKLKEAKIKAPKKSGNDKKIIQEIKDVLNDDFNIPKALSIWFVNRSKISKKAFKVLENIFGFDFESSIKIPLKIKNLIKAREKVRSKEDFKKADEIRQQIEKAGYIVEDTDKGTNVIKK